MQNRRGQEALVGGGYGLGQLVWPFCAALGLPAAAERRTGVLLAQ